MTLLAAIFPLSVVRALASVSQQKQYFILPIGLISDLMATERVTSIFLSIDHVHRLFILQ